MLRDQSEIDRDYLPIYKAEKIEEIKSLLRTRDYDSSKTQAALKAQYEILKAGWSILATIEEVDTAYNDFIVFMDLSE